MHSCSDNINRLEASLAPGQPGVQNLNPHGLAHRHGVVSRQLPLTSRTLVLSEESSAKWICYATNAREAFGHSMSCCDSLHHAG